MRWAMALWFWTAVGTAPLAAAQPFVWQSPFHSPADAEGSLSKTIVSVVTNDDPHRLQSEDAEPWCEQLLQERFAELIERRPDLADQLVFQLLPAGIPAIVTGGESRNQPARVILAFCDENHRLLGLCVGIPDVDGLQQLMEDVQEARGLLDGASTNRRHVQEQVAERSAARVPRQWAAPMKATLTNATLASEATQEVGEGSLLPTDAALEPRRAAERVLGALAPVYQRDVVLRFGITQPEDSVRLAVLEQHQETRRPWCQAVLPALIGYDWETIWEPVARAVWYQRPFRRETSHSQLMAWLDRNIADGGTVVLTVGEEADAEANYDSLLQLVSNESPDDGDRRWSRVREWVEAKPYRVVSLEQLVALLDARDSPPIDLQQPSAVRYLVFRADQPAPELVRQADSPSSWMRRLKRIEGDGS